MEEKKYQIFVSSTYKDLVEARDKIIETILSLYHFPVGMEMFSADDSEQWEIIRETIDVSDYYVIIIGHRYGSVTSEGISYTEKEYDYAKKKGLPILAFIRNRDVATLPNEREDDPENKAKLEKFIEKASSCKMCDFWNNTDDLATKVAVALPKTFRRKPQTGWVRGSSSSEKISQEIAELSTENRKLRAKVEEMEKHLNSSKPLLNVRIGTLDTVQIVCSELDSIKLLEVPKPLSINSIPKNLRAYISQEEIESYNSNLPTPKMIDDYNKRFCYYHLVMNESISPQITIENNGRAKANDIVITLTFPDIVEIYDKRKVKNFSEPQNPIPTSPLEKATQRFQERFSFKDPLRHLPKMVIPSGISPISPRVSDYVEIEKDNNTATIRVRNLIHTRQEVFDNDITIVPLNEGTGMIEVEIICEELQVPLKQQIPILVSFGADTGSGG